MLSKNPEEKHRKKNWIFSKLLHFCQKLIVKVLLSFGPISFIFIRVTFEWDSCGLWFYFDVDFAQYSLPFCFLFRGLYDLNQGFSFKGVFSWTVKKKY